MYIEIDKADQRGVHATISWAADIAPGQVDGLCRMLKHSKHGVSIEVRPVEVEQTKSQRGYYWKWCRGFAAHCGLTPDELHEELLRLGFGTEEVETKMGLRTRAAMRSTDLGREDYSHLIECLIALAADYGYVIPPPIVRRATTGGKQDV